MGYGFLRFKPVDENMANGPKQMQEVKPKQQRVHLPEPIEDVGQKIEKKQVKHKRALSSYIPDKVKVAVAAAAVMLVAAVSFFLPTPAYADPLTLPSGTQNVLAQEKYAAYITGGPGDRLDSAKVALFYTDASGRVQPFSEPGYFINTTTGETLWTETRDSIPGAGTENHFFWIVKVNAAKGTQDELRLLETGGRKSATTAFHGEPADTLWKKIIKERWAYGESTPADTWKDFWAIDSTASTSIYYAGGTSPVFILQIAPPTDTIPAGIILGITDGNNTTPVTIQKDLSYPNPTNNFTTLKTLRLTGDIFIFGMDGKIAKTISGKGDNPKIDLFGLPSGPYFAVWGQLDENKQKYLVGTKIELVK